MDKQQTGMQLIRVGAFTAVGTLAVYAVAALTLQYWNHRHPNQQAAASPCGCTK